MSENRNHPPPSSSIIIGRGEDGVARVHFAVAPATGGADKAPRVGEPSASSLRFWRCAVTSGDPRTFRVGVTPAASR
jgi:hypothetical protein